MNIKRSIISEIFKGISFSQEEIDFIYDRFTKIHIIKGDILITPGNLVDYQYYVFEGCLRSFFIDKSGKEHTLQFAVKDWWISDYASMFTSEKSILTIESLQDGVVYKLSKSNLEELCVLYPKIEFFVRGKLEKAYVSFQKRILDTSSKSAKSRYLQFLQTFPNIDQCIKNYHIASYLGITTESLSRIRRTTSI